jgi:hypothetical protein
LPDYVRCFALMAIPAVATTMAVIFLRTATNGVQSSIYVVYLKGIGSIGTLFAAIEITSGLGSLFAGRAMRLGDPQRTMLSGTVLSILICLTPFFGGIFALLLAAQASRGWLQGESRANLKTTSTFRCRVARPSLSRSGAIGPRPNPGALIRFCTRGPGRNRCVLRPPRRYSTSVSPLVPYERTLDSW